MFDRISKRENLPLSDGFAPPEDLIYGRQAIMKEIAQELAKKANVQPKVIAELCVRRYTDYLYMTPSAENKGLNIPALLLINLNSDFGAESEFNIKNLADLDEKLEDPRWLQRFSDHLSRIFKVKPIVVGIEQRESLRLLVRYLEGSDEEVINGLKFVILHELGHLEHGHEGMRVHHNQHTKAWIVRGGISAATLTFVVTFLFSLTLFGIAIAVPTVLVVAIVAIRTFRDRQHSFKHEWQADQYAAEALSGKEGEEIRQGAIYLLNIMKKHQIELRNNSRLPLNERLLFKFLFSPEGHNRRLYFSHPNESERIAKLEQIQKQKELEESE